MSQTPLDQTVNTPVEAAADKIIDQARKQAEAKAQKAVEEEAKKRAEIIGKYMDTTTNEPKKNSVLSRVGIFFQILGFILVIVACAIFYRSLMLQSTALDQIQKELTEQKDQVSSLNAQVTSLNFKVKEFKLQSEGAEKFVADSKENISTVRKSQEDLETKVADITQDVDDKFGRLTKDVNDLKAIVNPLKIDISMVRDENKTWQKDYTTALSDMEKHVTRAAGLVAQMRDEMNKKIEFISMVQEKMLREMGSTSAVPLTVQKPEDSSQVVHRQTLNSDMDHPQDKTQAPASAE